jgi:SET domain-containing protein
MHCLLILGYGVFATQDFRRGDFLLEYDGRLLSSAEAAMMKDDRFLYETEISGQQYW